MSDTPHPGEATLEPKRCPICEATIVGRTDGCGPGWILADVSVPLCCSTHHYMTACIRALQAKVKELQDAAKEKPC